MWLLHIYHVVIFFFGECCYWWGMWFCGPITLSIGSFLVKVFTLPVPLFFFGKELMICVNFHVCYVLMLDSFYCSNKFSAFFNCFERTHGISTVLVWQLFSVLSSFLTAIWITLWFEVVVEISFQFFQSSQGIAEWPFKA